jgi:hypothetical protein
VFQNSLTDIIVITGNGYSSISGIGSRFAASMEPLDVSVDRRRIS